MKSLLTILGSAGIVVTSFLVVTFLLNWLAPVPIASTQTAASDRNSLNGPEIAQIRDDKNLLSDNQNFANSSWLDLHVTAVMAASTSAPTNGGTFYRLSETRDFGRHYIYTNVSGAPPGSVQTFSVYFKPAERNDVLLEIGDNPPGKYGTTLCIPSSDDAKLIATKSGNVIAAGLERAGDGWFRCWVAMPFDLSNAVLGINLRDSAGVQEYQGDGRSGLFIRGPRFEVGNQPSPALAQNSQ
jgi:hypothetical protein